MRDGSAGQSLTSVWSPMNQFTEKFLSLSCFENFFRRNQSPIIIQKRFLVNCVVHLTMVGEVYTIKKMVSIWQTNGIDNNTDRNVLKVTFSSLRFPDTLVLRDVNPTREICDQGIMMFMVECGLL